MVATSLKDSERYRGLHPLFEELFDFLRSADLAKMPCGKTTLKGDDLFIMIKEIHCEDKKDHFLEAHREYIDIHYLLSGKEKFGWDDVESLDSAVKEYDSASDSTLFSGPARNVIELSPGDLVICFPEDAHMPEIGEGYIRKVVAKIRMC